MLYKIVITSTVSLLLILIGYLIGYRSRLRKGIVWRKTDKEVLIRPEESISLVYASTNDVKNRLSYEHPKKVCFAKKGKEIKIYFSEDDVLAFLGDAVPVVRCHECKYCVEEGLTGLRCKHPDDRNPIVCRKNDYCNEGKRK